MCKWLARGITGGSSGWTLGSRAHELDVSTGLRSSGDTGLEPRIQTDHGCGSTVRVNGDVPRGLECSHSRFHLRPQTHIRNDAYRRIDVAGAQPGQGIEEQGGADVYVAEHPFVMHEREVNGAMGKK